MAYPPTMRAGAAVSRAEDSVAYKYEDYREGDGRIAVQTQSVSR